ncbi:DUF1302 family protein [Thermoproteota archaeon]
MKKTKAILLLACSWFLIADVVQGKNEDPFVKWERSGEFFSRAYQELDEANAYEDTQGFDTRLSLKNRLELFDEHMILQVNGDARYEGFRAEDTDDDLDLLLREAYVDLRDTSHSLSVGRQIITWGKLDDIVIVDRVSPQDYKWFVLLDKQERKEPEFMLKYNFFADNFQLEAIYLPIFKPSKVKHFGSGWSVFGRLQDMVQDGSYTASQKSVVSRIKIEEKDKFTDNKFKNGEVGVRLRSRAMEVDFAMCYLSFFNRVPTLQEKTANGNALKKFLYMPNTQNLVALDNLNPTSGDLTLFEEHKRLHMVGLDFETVASNYGLRGEFGLFLDMPYLRRDFSYVRKKTAMLGFGIDHTTDNNLYCNLQFIETVVMDYEDLFNQEEYTREMTLEITKDFFRGYVLCSLDYGYNISRGDWMLNPQIQYKFKNGLKVSLGGFIFDGGPTTTFGRYSDRDLIYVEAKYAF